MSKIFIITARAGFPNGYGATSALRKYGEGFRKLGYSAKIMLLRPSEIPGEQRESLNKIVKGKYEDIEYEYMTNTVFTNNSLHKRLILYFNGVMKTIINIITERKEIEKIFFYAPDYLLSVLSIQLICKILKIELVGIKTESSKVDVQRIKNPFWKIKEQLIYKGFSSMIVFTNHLKDQLSSYRYNKKIAILPIIVDENMYDNCKKQSKNSTLVYMGTLNYREELIDLIHSVKLVFNINDNWTLKIIGDFTSNKLKKEILDLTKELGIENKINWLGKVSSKDLPNNLINEGIMLLPRRSGEYSNAGFPIKLGEYLLTGSPVVVTSTGEIEEYLKNNVDSFIVRPNSSEEFAEKINEVINNYSKALYIGEKGKNTAIAKFGSQNICAKMLEK